MLNDNKKYWELLDILCENHKIIIDRPKGSRHPKYSNMIYQYDYGYLENAKSGDCGGIDVWVGTCSSEKVVGVICSIDVRKKDSEIKILYSCNENEMEEIFKFHNQNNDMQGILIIRSFN
jgi:inorganic pyrophosphatase